MTLEEPAATSTETEAISRARAGDGEAFARLYRKHKRRVFSLCLRMVRDPMTAEDLSQEAFLAAFRKLAGFRGDSAFATCG